MPENHKQPHLISAAAGEAEVKKRLVQTLRRQEATKLKELKRKIERLMEDNNQIYYETRRHGYLGKRIEWGQEKSRRGHAEVERDLADHRRIDAKYDERLKRNQEKLARLVPEFEALIARLRKRY